MKKPTEEFGLKSDSQIATSADTPKKNQREFYGSPDFSAIVRLMRERTPEQYQETLKQIRLEDEAWKRKITLG